MGATEQGVIAVIRASRPTFRGPHDKIAFTIHSSFLAAGYILTAAGTSAFSDDVLTSPSTGKNSIFTILFNTFYCFYQFLLDCFGKN